MSTVGLAMIVKNEAVRIAETLASFKPAGDVVTIVDTGSTDSTKEEVERAALVHGLNSFVCTTTFVDFAQARNVALDAAALRSTWTLTLSGDEVLGGGDRLRAFLESYTGPETAFLVEVRTTEATFLYPRVLKSGSSWRYEGVVHEMPMNHKEDPTATIPDVWIEHRASDPVRRLARIRDFDIPKMESALSHANVFWRARYTAMLAQSYEALAHAEPQESPAWARHIFAAMGYYSAHAALATGEESLHSQFHFLNVADQAGVFLPQESILRWQSLAQKAPAKPEVALVLASRIAKEDPNGGLDAAVKAADVARRAMEKPSRMPTDRSCLWRAWQLAAWCAECLEQKDRAAMFARRGRAAGGGEADFSRWL